MAGRVGKTFEGLLRGVLAPALQGAWALRAAQASLQAALGAALWRACYPKAVARRLPPAIGWRMVSGRFHVPSLCAMSNERRSRYLSAVLVGAMCCAPAVRADSAVAGLSPNLIDAILQQLNRQRASPGVADMPPVAWDADLAAFANALPPAAACSGHGVAPFPTRLDNTPAKIWRLRFAATCA